jgi:uncharacterized membrane protein YeaQ/YmgE (transglycosylase-associated protein family)
MAPLRNRCEAPMVLEPMSVIGWIVIGAIAGWLAGRIVEGYGFGFVGNLVIGIIGACIGGLILPRLGIIPASTLGNLIAATLGAVVLLFVLGLLKRA